MSQYRKTIALNKCNNFKFSARNSFSLFTGHMPFQIFLLVGHFTNWTRHNLLTDKNLKKITEDVLVRCSVTMSNCKCEISQSFSKFGRIMSGDHLLLPALKL